MNRFLQFCCVGASGMVADFGSFHLLRAAGLLGGWHLGIFDVPFANMVSVAVAVQWNFVGNRWITFRDRDTALGAAWWRFNVFSSSTWVLNQLIVGWLVWWWGAFKITAGPVTFDSVNCWKLIAIGVCTLANFWLSAHLAFRDRGAGAVAR